MFKKFTSLFIISFVTLNLSACNISKKTTEKTLNTIETPISSNITKHPLPTTYKRKSLTSLPNDSSKDYKKIGFDFRHYDLSSLDLSNNKNELFNCSFDSKTKWPNNLPKTFEPNKFLDFHKDPGLNISNLHKKGITGKGVNLAIIDYALLVDHLEFSNRIKMYEEIHYSDERAQMHGCATASIAAGKTTGVAPDANLFFIASENYNVIGETLEIDLTWVAKSINRIIEVNKTLPKNNKIRVLSISECFHPSSKGYTETMTAIKQANNEGIFVISGNIFETSTNKFYFYGLDTIPLSDRNKNSSYEVTPWNTWLSQVKNIKNFDKYYEEHFNKNNVSELLLIPIDSKTVASPTANEDYVFYRNGAWSWGIPYIAGLYALACQVKPDITPEFFWKQALLTGDTKTIETNNKKCTGKIINPSKLISNLK